ncbi:MAG: amidase family protein [Pseudomonadota bacterium]
MDHRIWRLGAVETAAQVAAGERSALEVAEAAVERMRAVNPALNAVVEDLGDAALAEAARLDEAMAASGPVGPLHGVPVTIKVNVDQEGRATTNGVTALKDMIAPDDAPVVANLRKAGAVVIGRTNTPEFSFRAHTDNPLYGETKNPWGDHVSCGGSSGGAGAAVMAGIGALAHGNDIGGSLRFPAAANGAVTLKPGLGRVPAYNPSQSAERGMLAQQMSVQGAIARSVADVRLGTEALIAPDPRDPWHVPLPLAGPPLQEPIRVAFTKTAFGAGLHPSVEAALDAAAAALADAGYAVEAVEPPMVEEIGVVAYRALMGEVAALMGADVERYGSEAIKAIFAEYYRQFPPFEGEELLRQMAKRSFYAREWSLFLDTYPLVLTPFLPQPFFRPGRDAEGAEGVREALGTAHYSYSMNFLNLPCANVPAGFHDDQATGGQPVNVQIVARRWREDLALDAAEAVEARVGRMAPKLWARED